MLGQVKRTQASTDQARGATKTQIVFRTIELEVLRTNSSKLHVVGRDKKKCVQVYQLVLILPVKPTRERTGNLLVRVRA